MSELNLEKSPFFALPPALTQAIPEGILLKSIPSNYHQKPTFIGNLIAYIFFGIFLFFFWWFFLLIAIIGGIIALCIPSLRRGLIANFYLLPGEIILPHYPLRLGDECQMTFRRRLRGKRKTQESGEITAILACVEQVQYTKGTDRETEKKVIWQKLVKTASTEIGTDLVSLTCLLRIPEKLPPSFEGKNNQIRWVVSFEQNIPPFSRQVYSHFTLFVDPVIIL